jgi:hypothetical protein
VQLEAAGYSTVLQGWDFWPNSDLLHEMQQATSTAGRTIAVLSPAYFGSAFGEAERRQRSSRTRAGSAGCWCPFGCRTSHLRGCWPVWCTSTWSTPTRRPRGSGCWMGWGSRVPGRPPPRSPARRPEEPSGFLGRVPRSATSRRATRTFPVAVSCWSNRTPACRRDRQRRSCRGAPCTGSGAWARPSWRWSSRTGSPATMTWCGGCGTRQPVRAR